MQEAITAIESCKYELRWLQVGMFACSCITLSVEVPTHYCYREYSPDKRNHKVTAHRPLHMWYTHNKKFNFEG